MGGRFVTTSTGWLASAGRDAPWEQLRAVVAGIGVSGFAAADALIELGARVCVLDDVDGEGERERATILRILGAEVRLGPGSSAELPESAQLVVASPGWSPHLPLLEQAAACGVPVWGEVELAFRLRDPTVPWLCVTGTNGKTTTVRMLESMLRAAGERATAAGNVGTPVVEAVMHPQRLDVIAVELSSQQLHFTHSLSAQAAAVLNVADDHTDWHGSATAYAQAKGRIFHHAQVACVYNVADPVTRRLVEDAVVVEGCRAIGFTLGVPAVGMLGVVDDVLADRAFVPQRATSAAELGTVSDVRPAAPHNVENALAAAALARAHGVPPVAVREGLRRFRPEPHRITPLATVRDVRYVDDSKATNPHAAAASLQAFEPVVWVGGGQAKGARFDDLVQAVAARLRGVVLLGTDRAVIADALARHAPDVPVIDVPGTDTSVMDRVVREAAVLARPGDTVLLAPGCASRDMFADYAARGDAFAAAVARLPTG
jgi:UDP-N-acetylmuramoylalanine--D-glutamate ligase